MKTNYFIKKPKRYLIAFLILFCGLFANIAMAQDTFTWNGSTSNDWATAANWTKTGSAGTDTFPGQTNGRLLDLVVISNGGTPIVAANVNPYGMSKLTISNATGTVAGSTLTINSGATLTVNSTTTTPVTLSGGNIVNNGTFSVTSTATGASTGITYATPTQVPGSATEFGYSGNGAININISASTTAASSAVAVTSLNALTTYKFLFNGATAISLSSSTTVTSFAIRTAGGAAASPLIIGGTGFQIGSSGAPINGGLFSLGAQSTTTINAGTTLTLYSASTNPSRQISSFSSSSVATTFTNKGTINILGASTTSGMFFSTGATANTVVFTINNQGTLNINLNCSALATAPLSTGNGGGKATGINSGVFLNNTGAITLKNSAATTGTGSAIYVAFAGEAPPVNITNDGTINFEGSANNSGSKTIITNNGIINSNNDFISFSTITNSVTGTFNFVRTAATGTNKQVSFTVASTALAFPSATYTDGNGNTHVVVPQKFSFALPNPLITNVLYGASIPVTGTLTKVTGTGDASIAYSSYSTSLANSAFTSTITNSGTINTDTASNLSAISGVTTTSTSIIAPGGSTGKGIVDFYKTGSVVVLGKLTVQVAGNSTAGVDYDQIINTFVDGGFDVTAATLDITGISGTASPVNILLANGAGTITGPFASVIGLTTGWSVDYSTAGKVQLVYATPTLNTPLWNGGTSIVWTDTTNWTPNVVPDQNSDVTIGNGTFQPTISTNVNINSLTIASGATLSVTVNNLTVAGAIANSGTMTLTNNANLIQGGTTNSNTGNITVNRNSNALSRLDYTIWSSPVAGQDLLLFSPETSVSPSRFYSYNETSNLYNAISTPSGTPFSTAAGYLIRMPNTAVTAPSTQTFVGVFTGVPNNGDITKAVTYQDATHGYNMVGNPYPSTIDAQAFITANTTKIESTLYFWRKTNGATGSAYATYSPLGSTTSTPTSALPNGTIQVGQGFFVKAKSGATAVSFTNAMRVANNQNQIFRTKQVASPDRVWLNLTNTTGAFSQALVGYTAGATTGVDAYDAKYINDSPIALTSNINNEEYTIQGRPTFDPADVVALNFKTDAAGDYSIALDHFDGVFATGQDVYLVDSKTGTETNLKATTYTFTAASGTDNARFALKYQKTLKVDAPAIGENTVRVYKNNGTLYVNSESVAISNIKVFDIQGRLIAEQKNVKTTTAVFNNLKAIHQVLIVKIAGVDNSVVTKKVAN